ncbi:MAG TPA: hypothetical protein VGG69_06455 [Rhizomicrobium sp.]
MAVRAILILLGVLAAANGLWMLASPEGWYAAIPGVTMTGPNNHHFVSDIGLAYLASGMGMVVAMRATAVGAALALSGATWPLLHAGLHVWGWITHGFPSEANVAISEAVGVVLIGVMGFVLALVNARKQGVV